MLRDSTLVQLTNPCNNKRHRKEDDLDVSWSVGIKTTLTLLDLNKDVLIIIFGKYLAPCRVRTHLWYINKGLNQLLTCAANAFQYDDIKLLYKIQNSQCISHRFNTNAWPTNAKDEHLESEMSNPNHEHRLMEDKFIDNSAVYPETKYVIQYSEHIEEEVEACGDINNGIELMRWYDNYYKRPNADKPDNLCVASNVLFNNKFTFRFEMDRALGILMKSVKRLDAEILNEFSNSPAIYFVPSLLHSSGLICNHNVTLPEIRHKPPEEFTDPYCSHQTETKPETSLWLHFVDTIKPGNRYNIDNREQSLVHIEQTLNHNDSSPPLRDYHLNFVIWLESALATIVPLWLSPSGRIWNKLHPKIQYHLDHFKTYFLGDLCNVFAAKSRLDLLEYILDSNVFMKLMPPDCSNPHGFEVAFYFDITLSAIKNNDVMLLKWLTKRSKLKHGRANALHLALFHNPIHFIFDFSHRTDHLNFKHHRDYFNCVANSIDTALRHAAKMDNVEVLEWMWKGACDAKIGDPPIHPKDVVIDYDEDGPISLCSVSFYLLLAHCQYRRPKISKFLSEAPSIVLSAVWQKSYAGTDDSFIFYLIAIALRYNKTYETEDWFWFWHEISDRWPEKWLQYFQHSSIPSELVDKTIISEILDQECNFSSITGPVVAFDWFCNSGLFSRGREEIFDIVFSALLGEAHSFQFTKGFIDTTVNPSYNIFTNNQLNVSSTEARALILEYCFRRTKRQLKEIITPFRIYNLGEIISRAVFRAGKGSEWVNI